MIKKVMASLRANMEAKAEQLIQNSWVIAGICSFLIHLLGYGVYQTTKHIHWRGQARLMEMLKHQQSAFLPALLSHLKPETKKLWLQQILQPRPAASTVPLVPPPETLPLQLTLVDPSQASSEEPERPKYYAAFNSLAANPEIRKPSDDPDVKGTQNKVPDTLDNRARAAPPSPLPPPSPSASLAAETPKPSPLQGLLQAGQDNETSEPKPKPKGGDTAGDLAFAKPSDIKRASDGTADSEREQIEKRQAMGEISKSQAPDETRKETRPRSLIEARMRSQHSTPPSRAMDQEGGVRRLRAVSSLDAKGTPLGVYDEAVVAVIRQRWYDLLDNYRYAGERKGKVVLDFRLHSNGRITDMKVSECTVGDLLGSLCQLAVTDPAPYPKWPAEMVRLVGREYRDVRFTFFYE